MHSFILGEERLFFVDCSVNIYILSKMQLYITFVDRCKDWYHVPLDKARVQMRSHVLYAFFVWQHHDWIWPSHPSHFLCLAGRWHDQPVLVPKPWEGLKLIEDAGGRCMRKFRWPGRIDEFFHYRWKSWAAWNRNSVCTSSSIILETMETQASSAP